MAPTDVVADEDLQRRRRPLGPGLLVTAAFIGPGTVVTASKAGAQEGCGLLWAVLFACAGAIVLQSLAARVGIVRGIGLGEAIRAAFGNSWLQKPIVALVVVAIGVGNAAYQTGNLTGAAKGIHAIAGGPLEVWIVLLAALACAILLVGGYRWMQRVLIALVVLLSVSFLLAASAHPPSMGQVFRGLLPARLHASDLTLVVALLGTTIVPYNLFLHASGAATTWNGVDHDIAIQQADRDTMLAIGLGGCVTASILLTASAAYYEAGESWTGVDAIAAQLKPTLGGRSAAAFAAGLFAAGLTSSITAPMATAFALCGCLGLASVPGSWPYRVFALGTVAVGALFALLLGQSPALTIVLAQAANGLLLPIIACFLLYVLIKTVGSSRALVGPLRLRLAQGVVAAVCLLGTWRIVSLFP